MWKLPCCLVNELHYNSIIYFMYVFRYHLQDNVHTTVSAKTNKTVTRYRSRRALSIQVSISQTRQGVINPLIYLGGGDNATFQEVFLSWTFIPHMCGSLHSPQWEVQVKPSTLTHTYACATTSTFATATAQMRIGRG